MKGMSFRNGHLKAKANDIPNCLDDLFTWTFYSISPDKL